MSISETACLCIALISGGFATLIPFTEVKMIDHGKRGVHKATFYFRLVIALTMVSIYFFVKQSKIASAEQENSISELIKQTSKPNIENKKDSLIDRPLVDLCYPNACKNTMGLIMENGIKMFYVSFHNYGLAAYHVKLKFNLFTRRNNKFQYWVSTKESLENAPFVTGGTRSAHCKVDDDVSKVMADSIVYVYAEVSYEDSKGGVLTNNTIHRFLPHSNTYYGHASATEQEEIIKLFAKIKK